MGLTTKCIELAQVVITPSGLRYIFVSFSSFTTVNPPSLLAFPAAQQMFFKLKTTFAISAIEAKILSNTASAELKTTVSDIVIAVPSWFTDVQRRAILDAASIASLNVLRIINDTTAAALGYEKLKKVLSANAEAPINVEYMNDVDAASKLSQEYLEDLIADELSRIVAPIQRAIEDSSLTLDEIEAVELIGSSSRIPAVCARIAECFPGKTLSTTLNQEEAVARGATFSCVMLSPVFRVRDFSVSDINAFPIKVKWDPVPSDPEEDTKLVVFGQGNAMPSTKILSFYPLDRSVVDTLKEQENSMWENDKLIKDTE
ncbi:Hsp70 protein-domain-containing protein, partial [Lentinula aff. detonsa]